MNENTLLLVLVSALLVVFVSSTIAFLHHESFQPVGYATANTTGSVTLTLSTVLSITLLNDTINFGSCAVNRTVGYMVLDSSLNASQANNDRCVAGVYPDALVIQNDGSFNANVTARFSLDGQSYFNDVDSWFAYKSLNGTSNGGCIGDFSTYTNVTSNSTSYPICNQLLFGPNSSTVKMYVRSRINVSAIVNESLSVNFAASIAN